MMCGCSGVPLEAKRLGWFLLRRDKYSRLAYMAELKGERGGRGAMNNLSAHEAHVPSAWYP